ncbi:MAG: hypothetical protein FWC39_05365 [Bacteroidetes bacterium]|nr:hypothetical protein [Bacteroidota bacterium]
MKNEQNNPRISKSTYGGFRGFLETMHKEQWFFLFCLFIIAMLPMWGVKMITGDDFNYFMCAHPLFDFTNGFEMATYNGRFYFVLMQWVYSLPYVIDSHVYFCFMQIFPVFTSFFLFVWLVDRVLADRKFTLLAALFACVFYQMIPWHSMTVSHPFYFTFSLSLIFVAFHLIYSYFKTAKYLYLLVASVIFFIATLFYESYVMLYIVIFIFIVSQYSIKTIHKSHNIKKITIELLPFVIFGLLYVAAYFIFLHFYPSRYPGSSFSPDLSLQKFFKCINKLNRHAIPTNTFWDYRNWGFPSPKHVGFVSILKGLAALYFYLFLFRKFSTKLTYKQLICTSLLGVVIMYIPHFPLALSVQFTKTFFAGWVSTGVSFFGVLLLFASIIFALNKLLSFNEIARKITTLVIALSLFFVAVVVHEANVGITNDLKRSNRKFDAVNEFLATYEIKTGDVYYLKNLHKTTSKFAPHVVPHNHWEKYFARKGVIVTGYEDYKKLYADYSNKDTIVHIIFLEQSAQGDDVVLSVAKVPGMQLPLNIDDIQCDTVDVIHIMGEKP